MTKLKTMFGLCVLSALAICAFAAQGASANTAYECASTTSGPGFKDAHCKEKVETGATFKHVEIPPGTFTSVTLTNVTTGTTTEVAKLKSVQSGVTLELQATGVSGEGTLINLASGSEMWEESALAITFTGVTVTSPPNKGCVVTGGVVKTNTLDGTTKGLAANQRKFSPEAGKPFAKFTISGCSVTALNHDYEVTGSVVGSTSGATTFFTHEGTTGQGTLFLFGQKAGFSGTFTTKAKSTGNGITLT